MQSIHRSLTTGLAMGAFALAALTAITGCGVSADKPPTNYSLPVTLQGQVFAGRNYMAGATVNVYATQSNGVATGSAYKGTAKLLATTTAGSTGAWSLTGVSCTSPDQLYVTAAGGTPYPSGQNSTTLSANPNSLMLTAIGDCGILTAASGTDNVTSIVTDEASTVAAVWALRNFITLNGTTVNITSSATNYAGTSGIGTPTNFAGLAHAFLNANNLSPYKVGNFVQYTGAADTLTGGGLVPVQELNSLAYVQYLCTIGSDGTQPGSFTYCTQLYQLATPPGGTAPANSLQAMLNIANYPSNNATAILNFSLTPIPLSGQTTSQVINAGVYVPALTAFGTLTNDWSVAIFYGPGYAGTTGAQSSTVPQFVTIDANDDVFFSNPNSTTATQGNVIALTSSGTPLWASATDTTTLVQPRSLAADSLGNIWVANGGSSTGQGIIEQLNAATGAVIAKYTSTTNTLWGVAVDSLNNVWYTANLATGQNLHELSRSSTGIYGETTFATAPSSPFQLLQVRPDSKNNIWVAGYGASNAAALYLPNTGTASAPTYTAALQTAVLTGLSSTWGIVPDASGNAYAVTNGTGSGIYKVTVTGSGSSATLSSASVAANPAAASRNMDIDGTGTIWYVDNTTGTDIYQYAPGAGATTAYYPCYIAGTTSGSGTSQSCSTGISTRYDIAIDSGGNMWVASYGNSGGGRIVQILGFAAPTVPLRSLGRIGVMP